MMNENCISVSALNGYIKTLMDTDDFLANVAVRGEVSNFKRNISGHLYFSLKDDNSSISAVMFKSAAARLPFVLRDGMRVIVYGRVAVYEKSGQYQVYASVVVAEGTGELALAFERLKKKLEAEGLFDVSRKKPLPKMPRRIGIVTSPTGAAIRDMINVSGRRYPLADVVIFPSAVQGAEAPLQLRAGVDFFNAMGNVDVIIIGRGGGSIEDLWAFNDEALARTVAASEIPIISAVGHETDFTLCDFAADCRAPTPSAAAEIALPDINAIMSYLSGAQRRIEQSMATRLDQRKLTVARLKRILSLASPSARLDASRMETMHLASRLENAIGARLRDKRARLGEIGARLSGMDPLALLARGYSVIEGKNGHMIGSVSEVELGQRVGIKMSDGQVFAVVTDIVGKEEERQNEEK